KKNAKPSHCHQAKSDVRPLVGEAPQPRMVPVWPTPDTAGARGIGKPVAPLGRDGGSGRHGRTKGSGAYRLMGFGVIACLIWGVTHANRGWLVVYFRSSRAPSGSTRQ